MMDPGLFLISGPAVLSVRCSMFQSVIHNCSNSAVNCTEPPTRPAAGTWEWQNEYAYESQASYTCGPFGKFKSPDGNIYEETISECAWNKTWVPTELDPCEGLIELQLFG